MSLRCNKYTDFQPVITRASLYDLRRLPDASGEHGSKMGMVVDFCLQRKLHRSTFNMDCQSRSKIQYLYTAAVADAKRGTQVVVMPVVLPGMLFRRRNSMRLFINAYPIRTRHTG